MNESCGLLSNNKQRRLSSVMVGDCAWQHCESPSGPGGGWIVLSLTVVSMILFPFRSITISLPHGTPSVSSWLHNIY